MDIQSLDVNGRSGYLFEVDLEVPAHLHDKHNDYPLAPERLKINEDMLYPFQDSRFPEKQMAPSDKLEIQKFAILLKSGVGA